MSIGAILTDIEGTTTDINFVHKVLFPYAREALPSYLKQHKDQSEVAAVLQQAALLMNRPDATLAELTAQFIEWIDTDQKVTPLKTLQGYIWQSGYAAGDFKGHLYSDAVDCLKRWAEQGISLYVFSSGSVQAQKLLFSHSEYGDLSSVFSGYFDTKTGAKREAGAYYKISESINMAAEEILFLSDITEELDAAREAGMQTCLLLRGDKVAANGHPEVTDFYQIEVATHE